MEIRIFSSRIFRAEVDWPIFGGLPLTHRNLPEVAVFTDRGDDPFMIDRITGKGEHRSLHSLKEEPRKFRILVYAAPDLSRAGTGKGFFSAGKPVEVGNRGREVDTVRLGMRLAIAESQRPDLQPEARSKVFPATTTSLIHT